MDSFQADYETLGMFLARILEPSDLIALLNEIKPRDPKLINNISDNIQIITLICDSIRLLDREGLINGEFFQILADLKPSQYKNIVTFQTSWRANREKQRPRTDIIIYPKHQIFREIDLIIELLLIGGEIWCPHNEKYCNPYILNKNKIISKIARFKLDNYKVHQYKQEKIIDHFDTVFTKYGGFNIYKISSNFKY